MKHAFLTLCLSAAAAAQTDNPKDLQLFLLVGQSNMAGRGVVEPADKEPIPHVFMFTEKMEWAPAVDPLHFDKPTMAGVGIGRSFARTLAEAAPGVSIGLIPAAFGGSALNEWGADGQHYPNAIARARAAMKSGKLRGILWHQGEADSGKEELARSYDERFAALVERFRKDLDAPDVPVVVGQLGPFFAGKFAGIVNQQLATVSLVVPHAGFVSSAGLTHKGDSVHFNTASLHEFGRRYALAFLALDPTWAAGSAKSDGAGPTASENARPPDQKAFSAARNIKDPQKKIAALEKFEGDFPKSPYLDSADDLILMTLVKNMPGDTARISRQASAMYQRASKQDKGSTAEDIAEDLLEGPVLLKEAEGYARKGVAAMHEADYLREQREAYAKSKRKAPTDDELKGRFTQARARRVALLGEIYLKMGRVEQGRKLVEEGLATNPDLPSASAALGELAATEGRDSAALNYLIAARLGGETEPSTMTAFETLYRKTHGGSMDGAEAMLDAEYRKRFPNPVHVETYQPGPKRAERVVLAEVFTGAGCSPCAGADVAFDAAMERYARKDLVVLMYHQHIPRPDPMTNPDSVARGKEYDLQSVPTFAIDGKKSNGGGTREMAGEVYERFNPDIETDLETGAEAQLTLQASSNAHAVKVHAAINQVRHEGKNLTLRIALVEKHVTYNGENGIRFHPMVVRAIQEFRVTPGSAASAAPESFDYTFDIAKAADAGLKNLKELEEKGFRGEDYTFKTKKNEINPADLAVVVFLQDDESRHVLQAAWADLGGAGAKTAAE